MKIDIEGYESPLQLIYNELGQRIENSIADNAVKVVQEYGFKVDRDELVRALRYDRGQYDKGYLAGYDKGYIDGQIDATPTKTNITEFSIDDLLAEIKRRLTSGI